MVTEAVTVAGAFRRCAEEFPDRPFLTSSSSDETITYGALWTFATGLSDVLGELGVGHSSRVCLVARDPVLFFALLAACAERGATLVPVNPSLHRDELSFVLAHSNPSLVVAADSRVATLRQIAAAINKTRLPVLGRSDLEHRPTSASAGGSSAAARAALPSDGVLHVYTSGTMGSGKAVMLTHANLLANARAIGQRLEISDRDRLYAILPTFHMNAVMLTGLVPALAGAHVVFAERADDDRTPRQELYQNARTYWENVSRHAITIGSVIPSFLSMLLELHPRGAGVPIDRTRFLLCGTAPLASGLRKSFEESFGVPVYEGYGLTETTCWATCNASREEAGHDSVGRPLDCEIKIGTAKVTLDDVFVERRTGRRPAPLTDRRKAGSGGGIGEVLIRGPLVSAGYYRDQRSWNNQLTEDGFLRTGDLGFLDPDGRLHVVGRTKEVILRNGVSVLSSEIDDALASHDAVQECKTFGVQDGGAGERVHTACVLKTSVSPFDRRSVPPPATMASAPRAPSAAPPASPALSEADLLDWLRLRLSSYKWPDSITVMGYLPRNATGKVSVNVLRRTVNGDLCNEIFASLSKKRDRRAPPSDPDRIRAIVQEALVLGRRIGFLMYWGCGRRDHVTDVDRAALARLAAFIGGAARLAQAPPHLTLVLTDVHGRINGKREAAYTRYFAAVEEHARALGMEPIRSSVYWERAGLSLAQVAEEANSATVVARWSALGIRERLLAQARKHVEGTTDFETRARLYYVACTHESALYARSFPGHVFVTYNAPTFDVLLPDLPKVYLYSFKDGTTAKPWFSDGPAGTGVAT